MERSRDLWDSILPINIYPENGATFQEIEFERTINSEETECKFLHQLPFPATSFNREGSSIKNKHLNNLLRTLSCPTLEIFTNELQLQSTLTLAQDIKFKFENLKLCLGRKNTNNILTEEGSLNQKIKLIVNYCILNEDNMIVMFEEVKQRGGLKIVEFLLKDMNTPLNGVIPLLQELTLDPLDHRSVKMKDIILMNTIFLQHKINNILDYIHIQSNHFLSHISSFHISTLLNIVANICQPQATQDKKQIIIQIRSQILEIFGDSTRIKNILVHLLSNSIKYSKKGGKILLYYIFKEEGYGYGSEGLWFRNSSKHAKLFKEHPESPKGTKSKF